MLVSKQQNHPKKTNTNVLFDLAPKPSNTTKMIDVKAWDNLMKQKLEQTYHIHLNKKEYNEFQNTKILYKK